MAQTRQYYVSLNTPLIKNDHAFKIYDREIMMKR